MMFTGAFELGGIAGPTLGTLAIIESVIAFAWYLFIGHKVFFGKVSEKAGKATTGQYRAISITLIILICLAVLAPLIGYPFVKYLSVGVFS